MTVAGRVTSLSQPAIPLLDFLEQFHDIENRWPGLYDESTLDLIAKCARFQVALLKDTPHSQETLPKGSLLIASALRCLVLTHELKLVTASLSRSSFSPDGLRYWPIKRYFDTEPIIEVSESPEVNDLSCDIPDQSYGQNISSMLEDLLHVIQDVMMHRKPQDWPALLFTMSILLLTVFNWRCFNCFEEALHTSFHALQEASHRLCILFDITSKGFLPLQEHWTKEAYAKLVDDKDHLVEAFQWVHDVWLDGTFPICREICSNRHPQTLMRRVSRT